MYGGAVIHGICRWRALVGVRIRRISRTVIMTPVPACICAGASVRGIVRGIIVLTVRYLYIYHIFFRFRMVNQAVFLLGKNGYFRICLIILLGNGHGITVHTFDDILCHIIRSSILKILVHRCRLVRISRNGCLIIILTCGFQIRGNLFAVDRYIGRHCIKNRRYNHKQEHKGNDNPQSPGTVFRFFKSGYHNLFFLYIFSLRVFRSVTPHLHRQGMVFGFVFKFQKRCTLSRVHIHISAGASDHLCPFVHLMPFRSDSASHIVCRP